MDIQSETIISLKLNEKEANALYAFCEYLGSGRPIEVDENELDFGHEIACKLDAHVKGVRN